MPSFTQTVILYVYCGRCGRQKSPPISEREDSKTTVSMRCKCPPQQETD